MQIHYALDAPPRWKGGADLGKVALLHVTPGLDGVSRAANECERGLLPAEPTICVGQPTALDPSRAPHGKAMLWLQLPEAPRVLKGDAAGEIATPAGRALERGRCARPYADRVEALFARHIEDFREQGDRAQSLFAGRSRGDEHQSRRRRPLWRLLRPRPVLHSGARSPASSITGRRFPASIRSAPRPIPAPVSAAARGSLLAIRAEMSDRRPGRVRRSRIPPWVRGNGAALRPSLGRDRAAAIRALSHQQRLVELDHASGRRAEGARHDDHEDARAGRCSAFPRR